MTLTYVNLTLRGHKRERIIGCLYIQCLWILHICCKFTIYNLWETKQKQNKKETCTINIATLIRDFKKNIFNRDKLTKKLFLRRKILRLRADINTIEIGSHKTMKLYLIWKKAPVDHKPLFSE